MLVLSEKKGNENPKTSQGFRGNKFLNGGAGAMSSSPKGQYQPFPHHGNDNQMSIKSKQHKRFGSKLSDLTFDSKLLPSFCKSIQPYVKFLTCYTVGQQQQDEQSMNFTGGNPYNTRVNFNGFVNTQKA